MKAISIETLAAAWLSVAVFVLLVVVFTQLRVLLLPVSIVITGSDAFTTCVQMSQDRAKVTHRQVEKYSPGNIIHTAAIPHRGTWYLVEYHADGWAYQCDLGCGFSGRCFMNSFYVKVGK